MKVLLLLTSITMTDANETIRRIGDCNKKLLIVPGTILLLVLIHDNFKNSTMSLSFSKSERFVPREKVGNITYY